MDREVKRLKQSRIPIVKVHWNSRGGPEFTWEREDQMQKKYPHLFTNSAPAAEDIIKDEVKSQLPQILPKEVLDFATLVIQSAINESLENIILAKSSSQPKLTYEAATSLTEFELKKILLDKIHKSKSYQAAREHKELYNALVKSYKLDKDLFESYGNTYSIKRARDDKDKDADPSARSDRGLKKRKTSKDAKSTIGPKTKESKSSSSKGTKSQSKSSRKSVQAEEPEFKVADSDMPQNQEGNLATADKPSKTFDELMSTNINFSAYIMNGLNITNLTQETLLGPTFKLLKGTRKNFVELEYEFGECCKALSEKLDWDNPESGDYPFDLSKPLPLVMNGNRQIVPVDYFFKNDLKYLQGGISTMTYTTSTTKTKAAYYDLLGIEDMVLNIWSSVKFVYDKNTLWGISYWRKHCKTFYAYARGLESSHDVYSTKRILAVIRVKVMRKHGYGNMREIENRLTNLSGYDVSDFAIALRMFTRSMVIQKRVEDLQLGVESYQKKINVTKPKTTRPDIRKMDPYTPYTDPQGFIYVDNQGRNRLMRSDELYKFSDGTLTRLQTSLEDITKNIQMEYLPQRRWSM
ncbi:hypothetical protein Tco_0468538 [Tanacetum coccineum]